MNAISLFSGIGGMDIGFSAAGFNIIAQVEIDDYCRRVLKRHAPEWWEHATQFMDVRTFGRGSISGTVDVIFGGFPCQPHSVAGNRQGEMDSRNLWPDFRRIISEFRPRAVLLENVPGILTTYATTVIADLAALGYVGRAGIISAQNAGAPHRRERWFCVAYAEHNGHNGKEGQNPTGQLTRKYPRRIAPKAAMGYTEGKGLSKRRNQPGKNSRKGSTSQSNQPTYRLNRTKRPHRRRVASQCGLGRTNDGIPGWLDNPQWPATQGAGQYPFEAARAVPPGTDPNRTARVKALGNAVIPQIIYALAKEIKTALDNAT